MKISKLTFIVILAFLIVNAFSQSNSVFIVIDEIADNIEQLKSEFGNLPNTYVTNGISPNALKQIANSIDNFQVDELHIYVLTKPGAIIFNSIAVTPDNVNELSDDMKTWTSNISGRVVIHSEVVFTGDEGILLKQSLEDISGLDFITQKGSN